MSQCGFQNNQPFVCCPLQNSQLQQQNQQGSQFQQQGPSRNQQRTTGSLLPQPGICGIYNDDRIYGGERTKIDEFPWMVLLKYIKREFSTYQMMKFHLFSLYFFNFVYQHLILNQFSYVVEH